MAAQPSHLQQNFFFARLNSWPSPLHEYFCTKNIIAETIWQCQFCKFKLFCKMSRQTAVNITHVSGTQLNHTPQQKRPAENISTDLLSSHTILFICIHYCCLNFISKSFRTYDFTFSNMRQHPSFHNRGNRTDSYSHVFVILS